MAATEPGITAIKRLFARSGNRCAFPKCTAPMADGDTIFGEVCHIKGKNPGSPRHDPTQTAEQRNDFDNLILLCPNHHAVIDADIEAYTVERLQKMKSAREADAPPISESEAQQAAATYIELASIGQTGGIAAQNLNAQNFTYNAAPAIDAVSQRRQLQAVENLWSMVCKLHKEFASLVFVDTILTASEMNEFFQTGANSGPMSMILEYKDQSRAIEKFALIDPSKERPFVSQRVWGIFFVLQALYGRAAPMVGLSFKKHSYEDWRNDSVTNRLLRGVLPSHVVDDIRQKTFGGLKLAVDHLEHNFLEAAGMRGTAAGQ